MSKKVIIDCDAGVDDALAIILAMKSPELDVKAITIVSGNVSASQCYRNVLRIMEILNPFYHPVLAKGSEKPLSGKDNFVPNIHGEDGLGDIEKILNDDGTTRYSPLNAFEIRGNAVSLFYELIETYPNEITLIATGPLTNVAMAIADDKNKMKKLHEIVLMGGAFSTPGNVTPFAEFNIFCDPEAAKIVFNSGIPVTAVGLDVTHRVVLSEEWLVKSIGNSKTKLNQFIIDITKKYMDFHKKYEKFSGCYLHDPLAAGVAIDRSFVKTMKAKIDVETKKGGMRGRTTLDLSRPFSEICTEVDAGQFLKFFIERVIE